MLLLTFYQLLNGHDNYTIVADGVLVEPACFFLWVKNNAPRQINPKNKTIKVVVPHISQPNASPVEWSILYKLSTRKTAAGKVPIPPGVTIIASVASVKTAHAASKPRCDTSLSAENPR
jgi:hypothetical protein